ncbi:40S ribosomal protein S5-1 [Hordeum vulgare]|nr:40S ribosomal protein S5-1 [Hordeum vulgare]
MASPTSSMDKFFEKVISPDLSEVMKHPRTIEMRDGVPHIQDVQVSKKMGTVEARLNTTEEKEVFRCQGIHHDHGIHLSFKGGWQALGGYRVHPQ